MGEDPKTPVESENQNFGKVVLRMKRANLHLGKLATNVEATAEHCGSVNFRRNVRWTWIL